MSPGCVYCSSWLDLCRGGGEGKERKKRKKRKEGGDGRQKITDFPPSLSSTQRHTHTLLSGELWQEEDIGTFFLNIWGFFCLASRMQIWEREGGGGGEEAAEGDAACWGRGLQESLGI